MERTPPPLDRKSTRLNSSHLGISYAVFCLKKKKHKARRSNCNRCQITPWPHGAGGRSAAARRRSVIGHGVLRLCVLLFYFFFFFFFKGRRPPKLPPLPPPPLFPS